MIFSLFFDTNWPLCCDWGIIECVPVLVNEFNIFHWMASGSGANFGSTEGPKQLLARPASCNRTPENTEQPPERVKVFKGLYPIHIYMYAARPDDPTPQFPASSEKVFPFNAWILVFVSSGALSRFLFRVNYRPQPRMLSLFYFPDLLEHLKNQGTYKFKKFFSI